jgi:hypothetical protein
MLKEIVVEVDQRPLESSASFQQGHCLSDREDRVLCASLKAKPKILLPVVLMVVFALSRFPGLLPNNFSAAYALVFCAGVYFPRRLTWWLPITTLAITDILIDLYYQHYYQIDAFKPTQLINYLVYALILWLGTRFGPKASWFKLVSGGLLAAIVFYLFTNTASWIFNPFHNPEYTRTLGGWIIALSRGTGGYPQTWEFFRNTLLSSGLFTALFVGAMKLSEKMDAVPETEPEQEEAEQEPDHPGTPATQEGKS